jgi:hypothetical protein
MKNKAAIRTLSLVVAALCLGAGAAQADLGFYMILRIATPVLLSTTIAAFLGGLIARRDSGVVRALFAPTALASYASCLAIAWSWVFLFYFWR